MRILIACEESQAVCIAFRERGHEAYSCDIQDCSGGKPEWHIKDDARYIVKQPGWDMLIAHPVCRYMANSGVKNLVLGEDRINPERWDKLEEAIKFFNIFASSPIWMKAIENPVPHKYARDGFVNRFGRHVRGIEKYSQTIQPYQFGHMEQKRTCLWLYHLPYLQQTNNVYEDMMKLPIKDRQKVWYASPGPDREKMRSRTFPGIANAMATQWG